MPSAPRYVDSGASAGSTFSAPLPSETTYSWTPKLPTTWSPTRNFGWSDSTTSTTDPARITSPSPTGGR